MSLKAPLGEIGEMQLKISQKFLNEFWSGRRDSNPRHPPWQGGTLPLSYARKSASSGRYQAFLPGLSSVMYV